MVDHRRRYRIRRALAGSFLAAAATASLSGVAAPAASAAPPSSASSSVQGLLLPPEALREALVSAEVPGSERLAGVRAELDQAVLLRLVTPEQANRFYAQLERRVAAGL